MTKNDREYIQKLLANDKVAKAIKYLLDNTDISDERINKVIQISGDFNELEHAIGQGTISEGSKTVRRNRIRASLLKLILDEKQDETIDDDKDLTQIPTINLDKLVGRKEELTAIHEKLTNNQTLLIHGIRGVGKSVIAKYYINTHREDYNYAIWINVVDNIKESMLADTYFLKKIGVNMSQIKYGFQKNQQRNNFEPILKQLRAFKDRFRSKKNILILDNVTDVNDLKETLVHFPKIHWKIIVIANQKMGFLEHSSLLVNPLPSKESIELFKKHTDKKIAEQDELLLSLLLKKIENHPLTIELLSKYYTYSIDATLHGLLEMFESKKFDEANFNLKVETAHNDFEQPIEVYSYIYKVFDTNSLSMNEAMILGLFSILPPLEIEG
ncbi:MAG: NB-ARC domain-containing protein, partial [Flammeovirgaceae bacterium]